MSVALAVIQPAASCARCGDCCRRIWVRCHPDHLDPGRSENDAFMASEWEYAGEVTPHDANDPDDYPWYCYTCKQFDDASSSCMAHDRRPPVCQGFPFYAEAPSPLRLHSPRCSFWLDVPVAERPAWWRG